MHVQPRSRVSKRLATPTSTSDLNDHQTVSEAVISAVADAKDVSPLDLDPLITAIDPDALERLVTSMDSGPTEPASTVEFAYSGYQVAVTEDADVSVTELERR